MSGHSFLSFVSVLLCFWSVDAISSEDISTFKTALRPFLMPCVEQFGVTEEEFEEAKKKGSVAGINPCFMSCFMKNIEFFDSKGMFDIEMAESFAISHKALKSEEVKKKFKIVGTDCAKVNDEEVSDGADGCDRAKLLLTCIVEHKDNPFD